jgi:periplasmic copper chaperone A
MRFRRYCAAGLLLAAALGAPVAAAQSVKAANVWARATGPGQNTASVYFDLTSDRDAALVAAGSPAAARAELHAMSLDGGVMRMRPLARIDLPAGQTVRLSPSGTHLMLLDLKQPLKPGDKLPLVLSIQSSGTSLTTLKLEAQVRALDGSEPAQH